MRWVYSCYRFFCKYTKTCPEACPAVSQLWVSRKLIVGLVSDFKLELNFNYWRSIQVYCGNCQKFKMKHFALSWLSIIHSWWCCCFTNIMNEAINSLLWLQIARISDSSFKTKLESGHLGLDEDGWKFTYLKLLTGYRVPGAFWQAREWKKIVQVREKFAL